MNEQDLWPRLVWQLLDPTVFIVPILLGLIVVGPLVLYPVARWKASREPYPDPQLGLKCALHYFRIVSFHLLLVGAVVVLWALFRKASAGRGDLYRLGFGLVLPAALVFGAHVMLLMRTNDHVFGAVRRLSFGYNLVVTGLLGLIALVLASKTLFAKGPASDAERICFAALLVYVPAWIGCAWHFMTVLDVGSNAAPPQNIVPPAPMANAAGGAQGPGLPSLGGGFPPVNQ